jgi:electron transfer flavoprotein beta subunit
MRIVVCVKQVGALSDEIEFTGDNRAVDPDFLEYALNEWDACAIEEALVLREAVGGEVVAVTLGDDESEAALRRALAMGADRAVMIESDETDPIAVARSLAAVATAEGADLVLCGVQSSDEASGAVGGAIAGLTDRPFVALATKVEAAGAGLRVHRELEGGLVEAVDCDLPAVVAVQTGINAPRYVTFRQIKQAEQQEIAAAAATDGPQGQRIRSLAIPERGEGAEMLKGRAGEIAAMIATIVAERRS